MISRTRPWKGGDGGLLPDPIKGPPAPNARVYQNCAAARGVRGPFHPPVPTLDPNDRAHGVRDQAGMLFPSRTVPNARPREYDRSQLTSQGVSFDSAYDQTYARVRLMERWNVSGINRGMLGSSLLKRARRGDMR